MMTPAEFVEQNQDLLLQTLKEMTCIPAPSRGEHRRAGYCLDRLSAWGRASTDCNIPLSMGIPAVCCGLCRGGGAHTLQEWIDIASVPAGARAALRILEGRLH